ncbi:MAG: site-specific DNA-methyltransferase, partial [Nitrospirota bacterium]|nr:site-specific DNA-methyltransferase [Nitrospirota bacterium]
MPIERIKPEAYPAADRIEALRELFPEAFADGAVDWATLRDLASAVPSEDEEETAEHFGLFWPGKRDARRLAGKPAEGTLIPCPGEGVDEDKTSNVFIEGENLEVLKLLRKSYTGMVKMIYIDPPYNTGNDFVYDDNFTEPLEDYLRRTGQIDGEGRPLTTNKKSDGRFHSKWLSMMYPRLRLARDLLRDDGVIFVSIDDNEVQHLRMLMNEVFGEENSRGLISRGTGTPTGQGTGKLTNELDYILCYSKSESLILNGLDFDDEDEKIYDQKDKNGRYLTRPLRKTGGEDRREDRPTMYFGIKDPDGKTAWPIGPTGYESRWRCSKDRYEILQKTNLIEWKKIN